eukprot:1160932-Pelagomonas_calceolata.AAC.2
MVIQGIHHGHMEWVMVIQGIHHGHKDAIASWSHGVVHGHSLALVLQEGVWLPFAMLRSTESAKFRMTGEKSV